MDMAFRIPWVPLAIIVAVPLPAAGHVPSAAPAPHVRPWSATGRDATLVARAAARSPMVVLFESCGAVYGPDVLRRHPARA